MAAIEIESSRLPTTCVLDAGFMMLALNQKTHRSDAPLCRALWKSLVEQGRLASGSRVLIPAPVLAELIRGTSKQEPPRIRGIFVAPFTARAARFLSQHISDAYIESEVISSGLPRHYLKYDSLIAATAIEHSATIIALDGWFHRHRDPAWPVDVRLPSYYERAQMPLPLP